MKDRFRGKYKKNTLCSKNDISYSKGQTESRVERRATIIIKTINHSHLFFITVITQLGLCYSGIHGKLWMVKKVQINIITNSEKIIGLIEDSVYLEIYKGKKTFLKLRTEIRGKVHDILE